MVSALSWITSLRLETGVIGATGLGAGVTTGGALSGWANVGLDQLAAIAANPAEKLGVGEYGCEGPAFLDPFSD